MKRFTKLDYPPQVIAKKWNCRLVPKLVSVFLTFQMSSLLVLSQIHLTFYISSFIKSTHKEKDLTETVFWHCVSVNSKGGNSAVDNQALRPR